MHISSSSKAVAVVALASSAAAIAVPNPAAAAIAIASANPIPTPAPTPTSAPPCERRAPWNSICLDPENPFNQAQRDLWCKCLERITSTGTVTYYSQFPTCSYVTTNQGYRKATTVTLYGSTPVSTKTAVCTKLGADSTLWSQIDENGNRVHDTPGACPWVPRRVWNVCSVM